MAIEMFILELVAEATRTRIGGAFAFGRATFVPIQRGAIDIIAENIVSIPSVFATIWAGECVASAIFRRTSFGIILSIARLVLTLDRFRICFDRPSVRRIERVTGRYLYATSFSVEICALPIVTVDLLSCILQDPA
jgi:hypothetical protein